MKSQSIRVTSDQLAKLMADMYDPELDPAGEHLADEVIVNYTLQALTPAEISRIDSHLAVCSDCAARTNHLLRASQAWQDEAGLARLRERILAARRPPPPPNPGAILASMLAQLQEGWRALFAQPQTAVLWKADDESPQEKVIFDGNVEEADSSLGFRVILSAEGDLRCWFTSPDLNLEGQRIVFRLVSLTQEETLQRVSQDRVSARLIIPGYQLPDDPADLADLALQGQ